MNTGKSPMRDLVMEIGGEMRAQENRTAWLYRVSTLANVHYRLVRAAWHREPVSKETERRLRTAAERLQRETRHTAIRLQSIAENLERIDAEFYRQDVDALRSLAARYGGEDSGSET